MSVIDQLTHLLVGEFDVDPDRISPDAALGELGLDSLSMAELLMEIEEKFDIEIPEEKASFETLAEAATAVEEMIAAREG